MTYHDLLTAAKANPEGADYHALRMAFARSEEYNPYAQDGENVGKLREALNGGDFNVALEAVNHLLEHNYLDIEAHMAADYVHTMLEQYDQSAYHRSFARGLINAILGTGDGRDYDTAFIVLGVSEEYTILRIMGFAPTGQRLIEQGGHWFDILDGSHRESGGMIAVFFNIDFPHKWLGNHLHPGA